MIDTLPANLKQTEISAVSFDGLQIRTADGKPARLAIIDDDGKVIEAGDDVAAAAWNVAIASYRQFMIGQGHLRVFSSPPGIPIKQAA